MEQAVLDRPNTQAAQEVETLIEDLKRFLIRYDAILSEEGIRKHVMRLECWIEEQKTKPVPRHLVAEMGLSWLGELRDRLKLSLDEKQRLEGEGGQPASTEQAEKIEELFKAVRRIEKIIEEVQS